MVEAADPVKDYARMSEQDRAKFEQEHFDLLPDQDKMRVASQALNSGQTSNHDVAMFLDKAYGNGDGQFDQQDLKLIAEKREDKAFIDAMGSTVETAAEVALESSGLGAWMGAPAGTNFKINSGGMLSEIFAESAGVENVDIAVHDYTTALFDRLRSPEPVPGGLTGEFTRKASSDQPAAAPEAAPAAPAPSVDTSGFANAPPVHNLENEIPAGPRPQAVHSIKNFGMT